MNKLLLGLGLLASFPAIAQQKSKPAKINSAEAASQRLEMNVRIKGLPEGDTVLLWGPLPNTVDTAYVKNGSYHFNIDMSQGGTTYVMQVGLDGNEQHGTFLYLEAGKMDITGDGPYFKNVKMTGSPFVADWMDLYHNLLENDTLGKQKNDLENRMSDAQAVGDNDAFNTAAATLQGINRKIVEGARKWVVEHPNSGVSSFVLNALLSSAMSSTELKDIISKLGPNARNTFTIKKMMTNLTGGADKMMNLLHKPAPPVAVQDVDGKPVSLNDFKGKYVLLDFWASWCKPCRVMTPELAATYEKFKDKGFTILSVSLDEKKDKWMQAMKEDKMTWPQASDLKGSQSPAAAAYGIVGIPASFLISPDGNIIEIGCHGETLDKKLTEALK
ncbi:TlpA disulfide reductase family protein [Chitinophaga solisilvae]|uniref:TlpA disulfide reductase family protein n=1 Tax=Chitinophaga solisilvae TaxID=1233460 RepID=UPI0013691999|nr:TlpA disulfide reductase family protein [Chitinophaga solisilvae]